MPSAIDPANLAGLGELWRPVCDTWAPPPDVTVSGYADEYGIIPPGVSGGAGNARFRARPFQRAILDAFGHPRIHEIDVMKSARIGWTLILQLALGYWSQHDPRSSLMVQPTEDDCKEWVKEALEPFIDAPGSGLDEVFNSPELKRLSTLDQRFFRGGSIRFRGAQTGRGFRRFTVGGVLMDEIDAYPVIVGDEGDPIRLAAVRAETVWNRVIARGSTPLLDGFSRIQKSIANASTGWYVIPCPHCGLEHVRLFRQPQEPLVIGGWEVPIAHLVWPDGEPENAAYVCPECAHQIHQKHHNEIMEAGHWHGPDWTWRPGEGFEFEETFAGHIGFRIWAGYNTTPVSTPAALARDWLAAKDDPEARQVYINTRLGETYREQGEQPLSAALVARCEDYGELDCPVDVDGITAFLDLQGTWGELEVCGWKFNSRESWSIAYTVIPGSPDTELTDEFWTDVREAFGQTFTTPAGPRYIDAIGVDVGYLQDRAMAYVRSHGGGHTLPLKGMPGEKQPIVEPVLDRLQRLRRLAYHDKVRPILTGVDSGKLAVYRALAVTKPGQLYCHFPVGRTEAYFDSLTAERLLTRYVKGFPRREWHKMRPRNEALDCRVGNLALCIMMEEGTIDRRPPPGASPAPQQRERTRRESPFQRRGWGFGARG